MNKIVKLMVVALSLWAGAASAATGKTEAFPVDLREGERDRLLKKLGIVTDITKGERVQTSEVNANVCQASDYIYMLIDTFNKQCEQFGLPFKMKANGTFEELYTEPDNEAEQPQEEINL